jgi:MFS transporter, MFS domain-containing protein family, molybdate-anion transporter
MGRATLLNGIVATGAGVLSNQLVSLSRTFVSPFIASGSLLIIAFIVIRGTWTENYGSGGGTKDADTFQIKRLGQASRIVSNGRMYFHIYEAIR